MAELIRCPVCGGDVSTGAGTCPHCGHPVAKRCPKCGGTDVETISDAKKGARAALWGVFSLKTVLNDYRCKTCGAKFK